MICCVEDDESIRNMMVYTLNVSSLPAIGVRDGKDLTSVLKTTIPELIILDIMLPGEDGIEILKRLRSNVVTANVPIIMATAKGTEYDKVLSFDLGADDYLVKPFGMMEMVSRVKAMLRRTVSNGEKDKLRAGELSLDLSQHIVTVKGERITLTLKEYEILRVFMENQGLVFTRDQILTQVWGMDYDGETRTVDVHIRTLRSKIGDCGDYIKTVRGVGYRMEI